MSSVIIASWRHSSNKARLGAFVAEHTDAARSTANVTALTTSAGLPTSDAFRGVLAYDGREVPITSLRDLPPSGDGFGAWRIGAVDLYLGPSTLEKWEVVSLSSASYTHDRITSKGQVNESDNGGSSWDFGTWLGYTRFNTDETVLVGRNYMTAGPTWWQALGKHEFEDGGQQWNLTSNTNTLYSNVGSNPVCAPSNLSPSGQSYSYGSSINFSWTGASCASGYQVRYAYVNFDGSVTYSPILSLSGTNFWASGASGYYQPFRLGTHGWSVRAVASGYDTPWVSGNFTITSGGGSGCNRSSGGDGAFVPPICDE